MAQTFLRTSVGCVVEQLCDLHKRGPRQLPVDVVVLVERDYVTVRRLRGDGDEHHVLRVLVEFVW